MLEEAERAGAADRAARRRCWRRPTRRRSLPVTSWGAPRDLPRGAARGAAGLAWRQRDAELRALAAGPEVPERALRELLALQASDWAFLVAHGTAGDYPLERAAGHAAAFDGARSAGRAARRRCAGLAPHLDRAALFAA